MGAYTLKYIQNQGIVCTAEALKEEKTLTTKLFHMVKYEYISVYV